jgi:molybdopterin-binding protein
MNRFDAHIGEVRTHEQLSQVTAVFQSGLKVQAIVIETPETAAYLVEGGSVSVLFKETEVILFLPGHPGISEPNQIPGEVKSMEAGALLTWVCLETEIGDLGAIIPSDSVKHLNLLVGSEAVACIKTTEVMLSGR